MRPRARHTGADPNAKQHGSKDDGSSGETQQAQSRLKKKKKKASFGGSFRAIKYFLLLLAIPFIVNYAALSKEARELVPKGAVLYDIGWGQKMLLSCSGEGAPTVVLDAPIGETSDVWSSVQPLISKHTRVCSYDRAGLGFSDRPYSNTSEYANDFSEAAVDRDKTKPFTVERMVDDLHRLVSRASSQPLPLILVSSDFSTMISRFYAQLYVNDVAGLLLINPMAEFLFHDAAAAEGRDELTWSEYWHRRVVPSMQGAQFTAALGLNRIALMLGLLNPVEPRMRSVYPESVLTRKKYLMCQPKHLSSAVSEYYFVNESMSQTQLMFRLKPFPEDVKVTIASYENIVTDLPSELTRDWSEGEMRLRQIHSASSHVLIPGEDHMSYLLHSRAVADVIFRMVDQWRIASHSKL